MSQGGLGRLLGRRLSRLLRPPLLQRQRAPSMCQDGKPGGQVPKVFEFYSAAARHVSDGSATSPTAVRELLALMQAIPLEELGVAEGAAAAAAATTTTGSPGGRSRRVTYQHIFEDETLTFGIFCLPAGACIPLHDHPGMAVFSRLLYGSLHLRSYDWCDQDVGSTASTSAPRRPPQLGSRRRAALVRDVTLTAPTDPLVLFPQRGGNLHAFTALTPCAVLDLLTPPYDSSTGRGCTYYEECWAGDEGERAAAAAALAAAAAAAGRSGSRAGSSSSSGQQQQQPDHAAAAAAAVQVDLLAIPQPASLVIGNSPYRGIPVD